MATSLVTGGAGFIGSHIVEALVARGDDVVVLDDLSSGHVENLSLVRDQIRLIEASLLDEGAVQQAVTGVDVIFHLAALVSVPQSMDDPLKAEMINAVGTLRLLQAARASGVRRVVLSSTSAVYGDEPTLPKDEMMHLYPQSPYAISKLAAEGYCQLFNKAFGLEAVILRYFNVFGPRQDTSSPYSGVISIFVDRMLDGRAPAIFGDGEQTRDFVFVGDVVNANLMAADTDQAAGGIFNICRDKQISINDLFENLRLIFDINISPDYRPARRGDIIHSVGAFTRAQNILGWTAKVELDQGLRQLVASLNLSV